MHVELRSGSVEGCTISYSSIEIQMATGHDDKQCPDT